MSTTKKTSVKVMPRLEERAFRTLKRFVVDDKGNTIPLAYNRDVKEKLGLTNYARKWTAEQDAEITQLRAQGATLREIAKRTGRTPVSVTCRFMTLRGLAKNDKARAKYDAPHSGGLPKQTAKDIASQTQFEYAIRDAANNAAELAIKSAKKGSKK